MNRTSPNRVLQTSSDSVFVQHSCQKSAPGGVSQGRTADGAWQRYCAVEGRATEARASIAPERNTR